jgi:hypothetical protein
VQGVAIALALDAFAVATTRLSVVEGAGQFPAINARPVLAWKRRDHLNDQRRF